MMKWTPTVKDINERDLILKDERTGTETVINCSEGDTLFIHQDNWNGKQVVAIGQYELYDIILNFMSNEELVNIIHQKNLKKD